VLDDEMAQAVLKMTEGVELTGDGAGPSGPSQQQD